ncbi:MAG: S53 family peptidase, partial [Planctomycetia bacterium]|nr:S53 family peptidase [Planctomycetia bacterium]
MTNPTPSAAAVTPAHLASAYGLTSTSTGVGTTIAIVDAYNDPNIQADLQAFDAQYNLPTASLTVVNQDNGTSLPQSDPSWSLEIAMDVEWAHAAAPGAKILLVEANSEGVPDLMAAVATAANRANVVSLSWGGSEFPGQSKYDAAQYFGRTGVTFVSASGDDGGQSGAEWPASSPYVLSVGGTTLSVNGTETAWNASGSYRRGYSGSAGGVSTQYPLPSFQAAALGKNYASGRVTPDVALDANPNTGFSVYDSVPGDGSTGWTQVGGTSAGTPVWAAIIADADQARGSRLGSLGSAQTLGLLYGLYGTTAKPSAAYLSAFHDITSGSNFAGPASTGYDRVTGLGTPKAGAIIGAAASLGGVSASAVRKTGGFRGLGAFNRVSFRDVTFAATITPPTAAVNTPTLLAAG